MRDATNQKGFCVEFMTPEYGWRPVGFNAPPYETRAEAYDALEEYRAAIPAREFRIYPILEVKHG